MKNTLNSIWIIVLETIGWEIIPSYPDEEHEWSETICAATDWMSAVALANKKAVEMGWNLIKEDLVSEFFEYGCAVFTETVDYDPDPDADSVVPWGDLGGWHTLQKCIRIQEVPIGNPGA